VPKVPTEKLLFFLTSIENTGNIPYMNNKKPLLVNFIGAPASGKTTVAALTFGALKEASVPCELLTEVARKHIVGLKYVNRWSNPPWNGILTDRDQNDIYIGELYQTERYVTVCSPETVIISDSSPINAIIYNRRLSSDKIIINDWLAYCNPLFFYSTPVPNNLDTLDSNRVHSIEQIHNADREIPGIIEELGLEVITLNGNSNQRQLQCLHAIYDRLA